MSKTQTQNAGKIKIRKITIITIIISAFMYTQHIIYIMKLMYRYR